MPQLAVVRTKHLSSQGRGSTEEGCRLEASLLGSPVYSKRTSVFFTPSTSPPHNEQRQDARVALQP